MRSYLPDDHPDKAHELGLEDTPEAYLERMVEVFRELRRVLRQDGIFACNVGDSYNAYNGNRGTKSKYAGERDLKEPAFPSGHGLGCKSLKPKDLMMMPSRLAIAMQADGWTLRSMLPFVKRSAMPESATDRPSSAVEYVFIFSKQARYFWDADSVRRSHVSLDRPPGNTSRIIKGRLTPENGRPTLDQSFHPNGRNLRNSDFYFDSLDLAIEATRAELAHLLHLRANGGLLLDEEGNPLALDVNPEALRDQHFASFPQKLVAPLIQAGSSEYGCCSACLAPWVRVVERNSIPTRRPQGSKYDGDDSHRRNDRGRAERCMPESHTTGWQPSCQCCRYCDKIGISTHERGDIHATQGSRESKRMAATVGQCAGATSQGECDPQQVFGDVQALQPAVCREKNGEVLQPQLLNEMDVVAGSGESNDASRDERLQGDLGSGETDERASESDGGAFGTETGAVGIGASHQWGQIRQSDRESGCADESQTCTVTYEPPPIHEIEPYPVQPCVILDPFAGSGTTSLVASKLGRRSIAIELSQPYTEIFNRRNSQRSLLL